MENFIEFKEYYDSPHYAGFSVRYKFYDQIGDSEKLKDMLLELSLCTTFLCSRKLKNNKSGYDYYVHTPIGILKCSLEDTFVIWDIIQPNIKSQGEAMKTGVRFTVKSTVAYVRLTQYEEYYRCQDGNIIYNDCDIMNGCKWFSEKFAKYLDEQEKSNEVLIGSGENDKYTPHPNLDELLRISEEYSNIASEIEENAANSIKPLEYSQIQSVDYDRVDRVVYRFIVDEIYRDTFKESVQVEIKDVNNNAINGEIIKISAEDSGINFIDILFNKQISINLIERVGSITLTFSTVNKDIQLEANDKIRNKTSSAQYMDAVLGEYTPEGFNDVNLDALKEKFATYKYPPNPSQQDAIFKGINTKDVFLVMGPPGTGKTTVILEWIRYFVLEKHMRVLVSSQNNKAVDNVIERLMQEGNIDILRIGSEAKLQDNVKDCMFENKITALRQNIANASINNTDELNSLKILWEENLLKVDELAKLSVSVNNKLKVLKNSVDRELKPQYQILLNLQSHIYELQTKIKNIYEDLKKKAAKQKKLNSYNFFIRIFIFIYSFFCKRTLRKTIKKFDVLRKEENSLVDKYNDLLIKYQCSYNLLYNDKYLTYIKEKQFLTNQATNLAESLNKCDKWEIFDLKIPNFEYLFDLVDLSSVRCSIQEGLNKIINAIPVINNWATTMIEEQNYALNEIIMQSVNLVGATCIGINSQKRFAGIKFDVTIIDEAGQIQVHNALVPMSVSNKLIMLGDHKQIPPMADEKMLDICREMDISTELLEKSLFEFMYYHLPDSNKRMLDTQFRMPGEIADIISEWFYNGEYKSADIKRGLKSLIPQLSDKPFIIIDTSDSNKRFETEHKNGEMKERWNNLETKIIVDLLKHLEKEEFDFSEIGVISALKAQVKHISNQLVKAGFSKNTVKEMVATLDSFQGQERDIIIYSFTRSSKKSVKQNRIGFLTELRRLNVAISRCKKTMIMIGDMKFLSECESEVGYKGEEIEAEKTEKNFSAFIRKMVKDVENGRGELISSTDFSRRLIGDNNGKIKE